MPAVVITGSSSGIGRASALTLDRLGLSHGRGVHRQEHGQTLRRAASERLLPVGIDVTDSASITATPDLVAARSAPPAMPARSTTPAPRWRTPRSSCRWPSSAGS